jgi:hypothetical protein
MRIWPIFREKKFEGRIKGRFKAGPAGRAPCAGGGHFVTRFGLRGALPLVAKGFAGEQ